jgi:hypothetical protein
VLGGCLEYFSVVIGSKALIGLAFVLYLASFLAIRFLDLPSGNGTGGGPSTS